MVMNDMKTNEITEKEGPQDRPNMKQVSYENQKMLYQDLQKFRDAVDGDDWKTALEVANWIYERTVVIAVLDQFIDPEKYR